jgi:hypothetical protein
MYVSIFMIGITGMSVSFSQIYFFHFTSESFKNSTEELSAGIETSLKTPYVFEILPNKPNLAVNMSLTQ